MLFRSILCPALLAEPEMPEAEPCVQIIDGLLDWLHANFDQPISLSELETRAHYSRRSLQYAFRKRFGCGPMQYLRRLRLWRARQRIMAGLEILSVSDLAHGCGYLSPASFRRDFRSCFGIPPSQLLAQHRPVGLAMAASRSQQPG